MTPSPQDTQTRSRLIIGEDGPSDSALAAAHGGRLRRPAAERHAARCASRALCSGGAPWRYSPLGALHTAAGRYTLTFTRTEEGKWLLVAFHASELPSG